MPEQGRDLKAFSPPKKKKKNLRLFQGPQARLMHQREREASGPRELSEENGHLFTHGGSGGPVDDSRSLLTERLSVAECRRAVCGLVDADHGGAVGSPEEVSAPCIHSLSSDPKQAAFSLSKGSGNHPTNCM